MAEKVTKQDGPYAWWPGVFAAPFGIVGGSAYGLFDGGWHGMKTGFENRSVKMLSPQRRLVSC